VGSGEEALEVPIPIEAVWAFPNLKKPSNPKTRSPKRGREILIGKRDGNFMVAIQIRI
jgi:hypothetical protein